jgi:hypothetical protein
VRPLNFKGLLKGDEKKTMKSSILGLLFLAIISLGVSTTTPPVQKTDYGVFDDHSDVGPVKTKGEVNYDANRRNAVDRIGHEHGSEATSFMLCGSV